MITEITVLGIVSAILLIFILYFVTARGEKKKITITTSIGKIVLDVEIANTFITRSKGLMWRKRLGEYEGMLFVFDRSAFYSFWMFSTPLALDAIFFDKDGIVVDILEMKPWGISPFCPQYTPRSEAKYVLEVNKGFSKRHNLEPHNSKIRIENA